MRTTLKNMQTTLKNNLEDMRLTVSSSLVKCLYYTGYTGLLACIRYVTRVTFLLFMAVLARLTGCYEASWANP